MMDTIGFKISEIRKRKGYTQEEISDLSKINLRTLQRIEKGATEPRGNTLRNLCSILEININDVLDYGKSDNLPYLKYFHLSPLAFFAFPIGNIILPLILWLIRREKVLLLNDQGINLLNYQITLTIGIYISVIIGALVHSLAITCIALCLVATNVFYPIYVSIMIQKGKVKLYYPSLIKFIKE